jgi:molecular chaperone DnaK
MGDKIPAADKQAVESAMGDVKSALEKNDAAAITSTLERLTAAQHKLAEALYKQSAPGAGQADSAQPGSDEAPKGDVIDAEVVDEGKK